MWAKGGDTSEFAADDLGEDRFHYSRHRASAFRDDDRVANHGDVADTPSEKLAQVRRDIAATRSEVAAADEAAFGRPDVIGSLVARVSRLAGALSGIDDRSTNLAVAEVSSELASLESEIDERQRRANVRGASSEADSDEV